MKNDRGGNENDVCVALTGSSDILCVKDVDCFIHVSVDILSTVHSQKN